MLRDLEGWDLQWVSLRTTGVGDDGLALLWHEAHEIVRTTFAGRKPTDSERVKVTAGTTEAWLVGCLPEGAVGPGTLAAAVARLLERAPVARLWTDSGGGG